MELPAGKSGRYREESRMKRHPALTDLARDHFHALACSQTIRKARDPEELRRAGEALVKLWNDDLIHHFREEEEVLLPILSRHGPLLRDERLRQMVEDHAVLRDGCRRLRSRLAGDIDSGELIRELGARLEAHARLEDREIFGLLEATLSDEELTEVANLSQQFRTSHSRPVGPVKGTNSCPVPP